MAAYVVLIFLLLVNIAVGEILLRPGRSCVPTSTIQGPCHRCVCAADGVYHCRSEECTGVETQELQSIECEPNELYRQDTTFCSCSTSGHWRSANCKSRFHQLRLKKDPIKQHIRTNIACKPNGLYIIDCDVCLCKTGFISFDSCTNRPCAKRLKGDFCKPGDVFRSTHEFCICSIFNYYIDRFCVNVEKDTVQGIFAEDLKKLIDVGEIYKTIDEVVCEENSSFTKDCNECTCVEKKFHCSNKICANEKTALRIDGKMKKHMLSELRSEDEECIPGKRYKYKCNTCLCNRHGEAVCTTMICVQDLIMDAKSLKNIVVSY